MAHGRSRQAGQQGEWGTACRRLRMHEGVTMVATSSNEDLDFGFVPVPIRRSLLKGLCLALKSILRGAQAKFVNNYRLFAMRLQTRSGGRG